MLSKKSVMIIISAMFLAIVILDIVFLLKGIPTISATILYYTFDKKLVFPPLFVGILTGHFFIPSNLKLIKNWKILLGIGLSILAVCQVLALIINIHPTIFVVIGIGAGALLWNQKLTKKII